MSFTDNDYPVTTAPAQDVAWNPLEWLRNRLQGEPEQHGPSPDVLPRPGSIKDQMRKRQQMLNEFTSMR
jgi:hypothetical protein